MRRTEAPAGPVGLAALAALAALAIRLVRLDARSFWLDEGFSTWLAAQPIPTILTYVDFHPPGYYLLLKAWQELGPWAASDFGVRLISALASAAAVGLSVWLVARLALPGARLVGALAATSALSVWYAQEARMYAAAALAILAAAGCLALAAKSLRDSGSAGPRPWLGYLVSAVAAAYLSYDALPLLAWLNGVFLGWVLWLTRWSAERERGQRHSVRRALSWWGLAQVIWAAAYVPQLGQLALSLRAAPYLHWAARVPLVAALAVAALGALGLIAAAAVRLPAWRRPAAIAGASALLLGLALTEVVPEGASVKRHLSVVAPLLILACGVALAWLRADGRLQAALVCAGLPALFLVLFVHPKEEWRGVAALLQREVRPEDTLVLFRDYVSLPLRRYYPLDERKTVFLATPDHASGVNAPAGARIWLVEGHIRELPPILSLAGRRPAATQDFYRIVVRRFDG